MLPLNKWQAFQVASSSATLEGEASESGSSLGLQRRHGRGLRLASISSSDPGTLDASGPCSDSDSEYNVTP